MTEKMFVLRVDPEIKKQLEASAEKNRRSINSELTYALEKYLQGGDGEVLEELTSIKAMIEALSARLEELASISEMMQTLKARSGKD